MTSNGQMESFLLTEPLYLFSHPIAPSSSVALSLRVGDALTPVGALRNPPGLQPAILCRTPQCATASTRWSSDFRKWGKNYWRSGNNYSMTQAGIEFIMENEGIANSKKRMKPSVETESSESEGAITKVAEDEAAANTTVSEQMELEIAQVHEKINRFTQLVSEMLESGKSMLKELSNEFEERMILIHQEQMEKWQEEIKELRLLDASNEEADAVLQNAKYLFRHVHVDS